MLNILSYDTPHRKTYDTLCLLKARGYCDVRVWGKSMDYVKHYRPLVAHRPSVVPVDDQAYIKRLGFEYVGISSYDEVLSSVSSGGVFLVCGAGILPPEIVETQTVINSHGGYAPLVRGLDSFKWAVYEGLPLGVTTHIIGNEVDAGEIIERKLVPVSATDTFHTVALRSYELEIRMLVDAIERLDDNREYLTADSPVRKRMPHDIESKLYERFAENRNAGVWDSL